MSLIEVLFVAALVSTISAAAVPPLLSALDDFRAAAATRYVSSRLAEARMKAVSRSADVGFRFVQTTSGYTFGLYVDGNGDGVRTRDIQAGSDPQLDAPVGLQDLFSGVEFGALPGVPGVENSTAPGSDPIRLGTSDILTFTPHGTATSGSLYIRGKGNCQYAVRVLGQTGRTRLFKYAVRTGRWSPL